jgi:hypothetical protein
MTVQINVFLRKTHEKSTFLDFCELKQSMVLPYNMTPDEP